mgnify:CR=1 FL=1
MKNIKPYLSVLLALLLCLSMAACGAEQYPMQITVVNRTTYPVADIRISLSSDESWGENRLETTLNEGESAQIDLGKYTEDQLNEGFQIQFYGQDDEPINPDYDPSAPTFFDNGDFIILAPPEISVAIFLDTGYDEETYDQKIAELYLSDNPEDGLGGDPSGDAADDFSSYAGTWLGDGNTEYDELEIDADGSWSIYLDGSIVADGYLQYEPEWESIYAYNYQDGSGGRFALEDGGRLYISTYGYFNFADGMESLWFDEDGSGSAGGYTEDDANGDDGNYDSYDVSSLAGIWYYDGDLASDSFIVIDDNGGWSLYQRASGAENAEVDSGWIETADEANTFYAESSLYSDVSYRMYVFETDVMMWGGEDDYYERME